MSLGPRTLGRVFWRCLFLQAAWNRRGMQNLGFAYAIEPALHDLYADPAQRLSALERHLGFFNCHPYMAAAILGGAIHHEERVARGEEPGSVPTSYKATLQGPLAAVGDGFFWTALRPFFGTLAALGALLLGWKAVVAAVAAYNLIHLWLRWRFFRDGYRHGDEVVLDIRDLSLPARADRLRVAAAALCGLAAALVVWRAGGALGMGGGLLAAAAAVGGYLALERGRPLLWMAYAALAAGTGLGLALRVPGTP
jgi:PTS system mannose-specific IID component